MLDDNMKLTQMQQGVFPNVLQTICKARKRPKISAYDICILETILTFLSPTFFPSVSLLTAKFANLLKLTQMQRSVPKHLEN